MESTQQPEIDWDLLSSCLPTDAQKSLRHFRNKKKKPQVIRLQETKESLLCFFLSSSELGGKQEEAVINLLKAGCAVNLRDEDGETALFKACTRGCPLEVIKSLVEHGANVNTQDKDGGSALMQVCASAHP